MAWKEAAKTSSLGCPRTGVKADSEVLVFVLGGVGSTSLDFVGSWMEALILFPS